MLTVYRRHKRECKAGHAHELRTSEFDERKKGYKRCECPIFASGTLDRVARRQSTGQWEWPAAQTVAQQWDAAGSWTGQAPPPPPSPVVSAEVSTTLDRAVKAFLAEAEETSASSTMRKYRLLMKKLTLFAESRGYVVLDQWSPIDVRELRASWAVSPYTASKHISIIKSFFEFCVANEWLSRNPAKLVKNQRTREAADPRNEQKLPFSDEELKRMYEACETKYGKQPVEWRRKGESATVSIGDVNRYKRKWTGQDLADFISVSVYTGLRISDVALFHAERMRPTGEILLRTTKSGTHVFTWVPTWLQERIRERAKTFGPYIFGEHQTKELDVITDVWRRKLIKLWDLCGEWTATPTPHRFRHTFARILLQRPGVTVRDVAELLGNSEGIVLRHYGAWVQTRQDRLTRILQEAFEDKPTPNVVMMPTR